MTIEQAQLADQFQALLDMARQAERLYAELAGGVGDAQLRDQLEQLSRDKQRHAKLAERLLEIVQ